MIPLDSPQPTYTVPPAHTIPDTEEDQPAEGKAVNSPTVINDLPALVFGAAALSTIYTQQETLESPVPLRTVRLALRYGINAFDTSPWYGASEIILGSILKALEREFPRSSYQLMTKCGRYGPNREDWDYAPSTVRRSIQRSLKRLNTDYLDTVYMHDVEFVGTPVYPSSWDKGAGNVTLALTDPTVARQWGLGEGDEAKMWGDGDQAVLDAIAELRKLKNEGVIKRIGISGYPLPQLLRYAILVLHTPPYEPLDAVLSYSHFNLQNTAFLPYLQHFKTRGKVAQVLTASPFSMGLLTPTPPSWHPAPKELITLIQENIISSPIVSDWDGGVIDLALGYAFRRAVDVHSDGKEWREVPSVVGLSSPKEVHECVRVWRQVADDGDNGEGQNERGQNDETQGNLKRRAAERYIRQVFVDGGWADQSWPSGL
ncbi:hypothetical protein FRC03_008653 [Tulasnella sp. 419]|nr:hypothetical protein FRC03_008653 [Tulasnella sp. 419]